MADDEEFSDDGDSVEEGDIEALARASLRSGETILGEGKAPAEVESRGICNAPLLLQKLQDIEYKVPENLKRVPWVDTLAIDGQKELPKDVKPKDGVKLESVFLNFASEAVKEAYRRLRVMKIPCNRPTDFYAEMLRTDAQMFKVRARASEEQRRINIVEERKRNQAQKKFAKKARVNKLQAKADEKRQTLEDIHSWRKQAKRDSKNADERDLDDILDKQASKRPREEEDAQGGKKKKQEPSRKKQAKDQRYGFGGKKKWRKSNDSKSTNDFSVSPWGRKGKGKGKGKGGGGAGPPGKKRRR